MLVFASTRLAFIPEVIRHQRSSNPSPRALFASIAGADPNAGASSGSSKFFRQIFLSFVGQYHRQFGIVGLAHETSGMPVELPVVQGVVGNARVGGGRRGWDGGVGIMLLPREKRVVTSGPLATLRGHRRTSADGGAEIASEIPLGSGRAASKQRSGAHVTQEVTFFAVRVATLDVAFPAEPQTFGTNASLFGRQTAVEIRNRRSLRSQKGSSGHGSGSVPRRRFPSTNGRNVQTITLRQAGVPPVIP